MDQITTTESKPREFEIRFNGLHGQPEVVAMTDGELKSPREVIHVIEKFAYKKAIDSLKKISKESYEANPWTVVKTSSAFLAEKTLKELGEL